jgi:hypothetical protein
MAFRAHGRYFQVEVIFGRRAGRLRRTVIAALSSLRVNAAGGSRGTPGGLPGPGSAGTICDMRILRFLRALKRRLTPPGSRGSLDSTYRQERITGNGTNVSSPVANHDRGWGH